MFPAPVVTEAIAKCCFPSLCVSAEHPQAPNHYELQLHLPREGLEGHVGLGQDL